VAAVSLPAVGFVIIMPKLQRSYQMRRPWDPPEAGRDRAAAALGTCN